MYCFKCEKITEYIVSIYTIDDNRKYCVNCFIKIILNNPFFLNQIIVMTYNNKIIK